jgi:glycosyltransferase involved in cell wall biosynthesis
MRLLLAIPYYAPAYAFGGSVTVAQTVVEGVVAAGHEVTVATTDVFDERRRMALDEPAVPPGAEVVRFRNVSHPLAARGAGYAPRGLRQWLGAHAGRFDVVLLHDFYSAVSVMSARAAVRARVPFALQPLGTLSPDPDRGRPLVKRGFLRAWGRRTVREASALLYLGDHEARDFLAAGAVARQLVRMPLPLELPTEGPGGGDAGGAGGGGSRGARPTIAFVGRLHPIKGIDRLIEAIPLVRRSVPSAVLEIVGPGDRYRRQLSELAARLGVGNAVEFRGFVSAEEKLRVLREAHVSALLSRSEGLPMAALEAMACGTPVVLSHGCHLDEVDGTAGFAVPGTPADAAEALVRVLTDGGLRERLGHGAAAFAHAYRREVVMPEMVGALERLAAGG